MYGYGPGWGMMSNWSGYGWMGPYNMIIWVVILVLIVAALGWFFRSGVHAAGPVGRLERRWSGLDVLEERYARGEINRDEYLQKKRDIGSQ